jgi:hypothetical protein
MTLVLEFVSGMFKRAVGPYIRVDRGHDEVQLAMTATQLYGSTAGDAEVWKSASWWFTFSAGGEFAIEIQGPTPDDGTRGGGQSAVIVVTLSLGLLPAFLACLGPNGDQPVSLEISPHRVEISS